MNEAGGILVKNGFVRVVDVTGEVTKKRLEMMGQLAEYRKTVAKTLEDFKKKSLSSNEAMLKFLKNRNVKDDSLAIPDYRFSSSYLHALMANVGRIVQVVGDVHIAKDGSESSIFFTKYDWTMVLDTATMFLEKVEGPEVEEYKPFHTKQVVKLKEYGIKYSVNLVIAANNAFYPDRPDVSDLDKEMLLELLAGEKMIVSLVEPTEKRILVVPESLKLGTDTGHIQVYVCPDALEIVKF